MKPLSLSASIPWFLLPSLVFLGSVRGLMPALDRFVDKRFRVLR